MPIQIYFLISLLICNISNQHFSYFSFPDNVVQFKYNTQPDHIIFSTWRPCQHVISEQPLFPRCFVKIICLNTPGIGWCHQKSSRLANKDINELQSSYKVNWVIVIVAIISEVVLIRPLRKLKGYKSIYFGSLVNHYHSYKVNYST